MTCKGRLKEGIVVVVVRGGGGGKIVDGIIAILLQVSRNMKLVWEFLSRGKNCGMCQGRKPHDKFNNKKLPLIHLTLAFYNPL